MSRPTHQAAALALGLVVALTACGRNPPAPTPVRDPVEFALAGNVTDTAERPLAGVRVDVMAPPVASGSTDSAGRYSFPALLRPATSVDISATLEGYAPATRTFATANQGVPISLPRLVLEPVQKLALQGDYTLTVSASPACSSLPADARERVYDARLEPTGSSPTRFSVALAGATFVGPPLMGTVATALDFARVSLASGVFLDDYEIFERVGDALVSIYGSADLNLTPDDVTASGPFSGQIGYCPVPTPGSTFPPGCDVPAVRCVAADHRLTLTRR